MPEHVVGFQAAASKTEQPQQHTPPQQQSVSEFIVDDLKLFISPLTAVVDEFRKQLKR